MSPGRRRAMSGAGLALLGALATPGCGSAPAHSAAALHAAPGPRFTVLDSGHAPRRPLRRAFRPGGLVPLEVSSVTRVMRGDRQLALSFAQAPLDSRITRVGAHGAARFGFSLGPVALSTSGNPDLVHAFTSGGPATGTEDVRLTGKGTISARGVVSAVQIDQKPTREHKLAFALLASALASVEPFPKSAVGSGARWQIATNARIGNHGLRLTSRYRLIPGPSKAARVLVHHDQPVFSGDHVAVRSSAGEWTYFLAQVFPRGSETLSRPIASKVPRGLVITSEVHIGARR